jgi:NAD(P)-dependent dehydrogenase (short-subunit alcohol dehydrogenase family)
MVGPHNVFRAAEIQLALSLAVEWGKHNVRVNCIATGLIRTNFAHALRENPQTLKAVASRTALGRIGETDEIAGAPLSISPRRPDRYDRADHRHRWRRDDRWLKPPIASTHMRNHEADRPA